MESCSDWYRSAADDRCLDPAREAYEQARVIFQNSFPDAGGKNIAVTSTDSVDDVLRVVHIAKNTYEGKSKTTGPKKWLSLFARRVNFYSNILDVFVQHHPEYVALVWGAMKALFVLFTNHDNKIKLLAKALTLIANALPRAQLALILYPTKQIKQAVAELYAHILNFCVRAKKWYEGGALKHALQALTHPVELEYTDVIEDINSSSGRIHSQAEAGAQAEQRDMHLLLLKMAKQQQTSDAAIGKLQAALQECRTFISSSHVQLTHGIQDLQISQILDYTSMTSKFDELKCFQACLHARRRRLHHARNSQTAPVWQLPKVQNWNKLESSSLLVAVASRQSMPELKHFCTDVVQYLRRVEIPVVWALLPPSKLDAQVQLTTLEVFKSIVGQAIRLSRRMHNQIDMNLTCQQVRTVDTEDDWLAILGGIICNMSCLYIVLDLNILSLSCRPMQESFTWSRAFNRLFQELVKRGSKTILKVIIVHPSRQLIGQERPNACSFHVSVGNSGRSIASMRRDVPVRVGRRRDVAKNGKMDFKVK